MKFAKLFNDDNTTKLIGLLTILSALWLVLYLIPEVFVSLFNTLLGNLIIVLSVALLYAHHRLYGILMGLTALVLYRFSQLSREPFTPKSEQDFLAIQNTINRRTVFDMDVIRAQASQEEIDYFNQHGMWPWSQRVIELYEQAVNANPYVRTVANLATEYARRIYNQTAILRVLSYQTKEGQFLLNGVLVRDPSGNQMEGLPSGFGTFPYEAGLIDHRTDDIIKCNMNNEADPTLERIQFTGKGVTFGEQTTERTPVDYRTLEQVIPGFAFLDKPCNPCGAVATTPDYSCAYRLRVKDKPPFVSNVWQYLWGINDNPLESQPSFLRENINPNEFPLLSELQTELQKQRS